MSAASFRPYPVANLGPRRTKEREEARPLDQVSTRRAFLGPDPSSHLVKCRTVSESVRQSPTHRVFRCLSQQHTPFTREIHLYKERKKDNRVYIVLEYSNSKNRNKTEAARSSTVQTGPTFSRKSNALERSGIVLRKKRRTEQRKGLCVHCREI